MAETPNPIDLSLCDRYAGEELRPVDVHLLKYAQDGATEAFDRYARHALDHVQRPDRAEMTPALYTGAAVGAMILRAEAKMPGAVEDFKTRKRAITDVVTGRGGGVIRGMMSALGDEVTGAGSITGVYLATNAADDNPDFSVWHTPPGIGVKDRIQAARHKGSSRNFGPTKNGGEVWTGDHVADECRKYVQAYLAREYHITANNVPAILAGGYGAAMIRSGALARAYRSNDRIAQRQIEDYVTAMKRTIAGRGEGAIVSELNNPDFARVYQLGYALLDRAGIRPRSWHGVLDGISQAQKAVRGTFSTTTVKYGSHKPSKGHEQPKEFTEPMEQSTRVRPGTRTVGGALPAQDERGRAKKGPVAPGAEPAPATGGAASDGRPRLSTPGGIRRELHRAREMVARPLTVMVAARNIHIEMVEAQRNARTYPHWPELFAASRLRIDGKRSTEDEMKYFGLHHNTIARLAFGQLIENGTLENLENDGNMTTESYAATLEVRRWLTSVANGRLPKSGIGTEEARQMVLRITRAQQRHVRKAYDMPEDEPMSPALFETLNELNLLRLAGMHVIEQPQQHQPFLLAVITRVVRAMQSLQPDEVVPDGAAASYWSRTRRAMHTRGSITKEDLPAQARAQYDRLKRLAVGFFPDSMRD